MKTYENYRPCHSPNLSKIPSHWESCKLRYLAKIQTGTTPTSAKEDAFQEEGGLPWFTPDDLDETGAPSQASKFLTTQGEEEVKPIAAGSTLICCIGSIGKAGIIEVAASSNQQINAVTFRESSRFGFYSILGCKEAMECLATGNVLRILNSTRLGSIELPLPPGNERELISRYLDRETAKIDALIAEQQRLIELLQEKRQAVISHAVTKGLNPNSPMKDSGVEWLGEVPEHWPVCAVGHRYEVRLGKMLDEKRITGQSPGPYLRNTDVQWESINTDELPEMDFEPSEYERYSLKEGDLLVCEGGEVGRCAIWEAELTICFYQKALHRLRPLDSSLDNPRFQLYIMRMACSKGVFEASSGKATINHLPAEAFRRYRFAYPPAHEQHSISEHLSGACEDLNALQKEAQSLVGKLQERRSSLISAAVTGQIDVRGLVEAEAGMQ